MTKPAFRLIPLLGITACGLIDVKPNTEEFDIYTADCPSTESLSIIHVTFDMEKIYQCFGNPQASGFNAAFETALDNAGYSGWEVIDSTGCDYTVDPSHCTLTLSSGISPWLTFIPSNTCGCNAYNDPTEHDVEDCCSYTIAESDWEDLQSDLIGNLAGECLPTGMSGPSSQPPLPESGEFPFDNADWEVCGSYEVVVTNASADYYLTIDPVHSYLSITSGSDSLLTPLTGAGAAATGPARFLEAVMWADDASLGTTDYENWRFGLNQTMAISITSGNFTISPTGAPLMKGRGDIDGSALCVNDGETPRPPESSVEGVEDDPLVEVPQA